jgi:site-specific DNA recombinase
MQRAAIYVRVSHDPDGNARSPDEQLAAGKETCARNGWKIVGTFEDAGIGASRHSKGNRRGFGELQQAIRDGQVDVVVIWEASRLARDLRTYLEFRDLMEEHDVKLCVGGKIVDPRLLDDRFSSAMDALFAERESDLIRSRVRRAVAANAATGRPHGRVPFGYKRSYDERTKTLLAQLPDDTEAPVVRRIFSEYLSGLGVRTVARLLNEAGITTSTGCAWNDAQVRRVLRNPTYAGRRVHQGEVLADVKGTWEPLVCEIDFDRVQARLDAQRTSKERQSRMPRLLSGVSRCGVCGGKMPVGHDRNHRKVYQCRDGFHTSRDMKKLDAYVESVLLHRLTHPDVHAALVDDPETEDVTDLRAEQAMLESQRSDAINSLTRGKIKMATFNRIEQSIEQRMSEIDREVRRRLVPVSVDLPSQDIEEWWDLLPIESRRQVVGAVIAAVVISRTQSGVKAFNPSAVAIEWRR